MRISAIAAIGENRELGAKNKLLWNIPGELKRFKEITTGHPIIMGRKTFESIGRPLPNRLNIVLTRDKQKGEVNQDTRLIFLPSLDGAIDLATKEEQRRVQSGIPNTKYQILNTEHEVFIIGGGQIFVEALPQVQRLYLTIVHKRFPNADAFFPEYKEFTKVIAKEDMIGLEFTYTFLTLEK